MGLNINSDVLIKVIDKCLNVLQLIQQRLTKNDKKYNSNLYEDLTPIDNIPEGKAYIDALDWALSNQKIKNIAITGPYGSGKSSIIKTFENQNKIYSFLNISLASFFDESKKDDEPKLDLKEIQERHRLIEFSILQQIFYKVRGEDIPDSRFNRIKSIKWKDWIFILPTFIFTLISASFILNPMLFTRLSWWKTLEPQFLDLALYVSFSLVLFGGCNLLMHSIRLFNHSQFNKLNLTSGEIVIDKKSDASILNKHLDEILYFFQATKFNIVVIEDLDRFNDPDIFTKLRELNILINQSKQVNRHVVFIYAIKDDMFKDNTRAKFFDFIIPVIPVVNSSNSLGIMLDKIKKSNLNPEISESFLADITLYISDMRVLKNIFNEFIIYKDSLKGVPIKFNKLLAIIIYKNIYPDDFALLNNNEGIVYSTFSLKNEIIKDSIGIKLTTLERLTQKLNDLNKIQIKNNGELRAIYIENLIENLPSNANGIILSNGKKSWADLKTDENFNLLLNQTNINFSVPDSYGREIPNPSNFSFKTIEDKVNVELSYSKREDLLKEIANGEINNIKLQIEKLQTEIAEINLLSLMKILEQNPDSFNLFENSFKEKKLLVYLIREGYIDEMYPSLISYFREGSLTFNDNSFLLSVKDREPLEFNYPLTKIEGLLKRLNAEEFKREAILNVHLVDFLIENVKSHKDKFEIICGSLGNKTQRSLSFIDTYFFSGNHVSFFINAICNNWVEICNYILLESDFSKEKKNDYINLIINHLEIGLIEKINLNSVLSNYISSFTEVALSAQNSNALLKLKQVVEVLNVKFKRIEYFDEKTGFFEFMYKNGHYEINLQMIEIILSQEKKSDSEIFERLKKSNFSTIRNSGNTFLIEYIENNIELYLNNVFFKLNDNTEEEEESLLILLNNENVSDLEKGNIIKQQEIIFNDFENLPSTLWPQILENRKIKISWDSILKYYELNSELDSTLIEYLNSKEVYEKLSQTKMDEEYQVSFDISFDIIESLEITDESISFLAKSMHYIISDLDGLELLSNIRIDIFIQESIIRLSPDAFLKFREIFPNKHISIIEREFDQFLKTIDEYQLEVSDFTLLFKSDKIKPTDKSKMASLITLDMISSSHELATLLGSLLLETGLNSIEMAVCQGILSFTKNSKDKPKLLNIFLDSPLINSIYIDEFLKLTGLPYIDLTFTAKRPYIPNTPINLSILEKLKKLRFISKYSFVKKGIWVINRQK